MCTRLTGASDKAYQLHAHGRWFSLGTSASSTTKSGSHDIAEILLKVALKHQKSINPLKCLYQYRPLSDLVYVLRISIMTFSIFPLDVITILMVWYSSHFIIHIYSYISSIYTMKPRRWRNY